MQQVKEPGPEKGAYLLSSEKKCFKRVAESTALIIFKKLGTFPAARTPGQLEFHEINSLRVLDEFNDASIRSRSKIQGRN